MPATRSDAGAALRKRFVVEGPQVLRIVVTAAVSWQLCVWLGANQPPVFAVVVPLVAVRDHPYSVFNLSFDRMIGVIGGVLLAELAVELLGTSLLSVMLVLALGLTAGIVLRIGATLNVQIAVSAMLVFASADPNSYAVSRIWETAVGAVVSIALSPLLLPPNARKTFEAELDGVVDALGDHLDRLRQMLGEATSDQYAELRNAAVRTEAAASTLPTSLAAAERAVRHNPLRRPDVMRLAVHRNQVRRIGEVARLERLLLDEVVDLSSRPDLTPVWPQFREPLLRVLEVASAAVVVGLRPEPSPTRLAEILAAADAEVLRWRDIDSRPITAVMRRPLRRLLNVFTPATATSGGPPERPLESDHDDGHEPSHPV